MFRVGDRVVGQVWKRNGCDTVASCRGSGILAHVLPRKVVCGRVTVYEGCGTRTSGSRGGNGAAGVGTLLRKSESNVDRGRCGSRGSGVIDRIFVVVIGRVGGKGSHGEGGRGGSGECGLFLFGSTPTAFVEPCLGTNKGCHLSF